MIFLFDVQLRNKYDDDDDDDDDDLAHSLPPPPLDTSSPNLVGNHVLHLMVATVGYSALTFNSIPWFSSGRVVYA